MPAEPVSITTPAPIVGSPVILSSEDADGYYLIPEEDRTVVIDESCYYLIEEENRVWLI